MNQQTEQNSGPEVKKPPTSKFSLFLVGGLVFVMLFVVGYKLLSNTSTTPQSPQIPQTSITNQTVNWETYINREKYYQFKYPQNAELVEESGTPQYTVVKRIFNNEPNEQYNFRVGIVSELKNTTFEDYVNDYYNASVNSSKKCLGDAQTTSLDQTTLAGMQSYHLKQLNCYDTDTDIYLTLFGDKIYYVSVGATGANKLENIKEANQILSTFKFLE